jgi:hypothetical protein
MTSSFHSMEPPVSDEHGGTITMGGERQGEEEIVRAPDYSDRR